MEEAWKEREAVPVRQMDGPNAADPDFTEDLFGLEEAAAVAEPPDDEIE